MQFFNYLNIQLLSKLFCSPSLKLCFLRTLLLTRKYTNTRIIERRVRQLNLSFKIKISGIVTICDCTLFLFFSYTYDDMNIRNFLLLSSSSSLFITTIYSLPSCVNLCYISLLVDILNLEILIVLSLLIV